MTTNQNDLVWGARNIGKVIDRTEKATFTMLEAGKIPGARKVGGRWAFQPSVFFATFQNAVAA